MPEYSAIYETAIDRITSSYATCSKAEQKLMKQILEEMATTGYSYTLEQIWLSDFKGIPVSIDEFICSPVYLGSVNRNGEAVYDFWRQTFRDIFNAGNRYNEICLSGATRVGKTSSMTTIMAYMLYRLMLYRNPHEYFKKKEVSRFTLAFANLTKDLAYGVAYREFQDTLKEVQWFNEHGKFSRSDRNFYYMPEGDKIDIVAGSDSSNFLGMQIWACLTGDTLINTDNGIKSLHELYEVNNECSIKQFNGPSCNSPVVLTKYVKQTVVIWSGKAHLEGTLDHRIMLYDGTYCTLCEITPGMLLMSTSYSSIEITHVTYRLYKEPVPVYDVVNMVPNHNFLIRFGNNDIVSHNCAMDEVSFAKSGVKDIALAKQHMKKLYDTVNARISGTFRISGEVYGKLIASSSKNQDNDFLSEHIETQQKAGNGHLYLVDEPQWKILPKSMFSDKVFHFTVGDRYKKGFVIPEENDDEEHRAEYEKLGYQVIEAPAEFRKNFMADYDISLRDIAGISVAGAMGFITQESITPCVSLERINPFYEDVLVIGKDDDLEISDFFHIEAVPQELKYQQLNIHLDLAESHNRTGIVGCCVSGNKVVETDEGKKAALPFIKEVFAVGIEAPRGGRMSYQKVVNFMIYLRQNHFNVGTITADKFQSSFLIQTLEQQGFDAKGLSPGMNEFIGLRNLIVDQRIELVKCALQEDELISTQRMNNKIYHPEDEGGGHGDVAESLCGSASSLIAEQVSSRPPARNLAAITAAVNRGMGKSRSNPMSSSNTINRSSDPDKTRPVHFPRLR